MHTTLLRRGVLVALTATILLTAVAPVAADSRHRKIEPRRTVRYRVGRVFTPNTDVTSVSGYAAWMIDELLATSTPLPRLGAAFMKAERKEGLNARYFLAHAMLESGWGTSDIARFKRNLFGYNAYDRNPWKHASRFRTFQKGIATVAARVHDRYLRRTGRWWYGFTTLRGMNRYYASDPRWADKIARIANQIDRRVVTLRERRLRFGTPAFASPPTIRTVAALDVQWRAKRGAVLPSRIRFAVRWVPVALVESAATGPAKAPATRWALVSRKDMPGDAVSLAVRTPSQPGLWRLDVEARDSDGRSLPKTDRPGIPSISVRVATEHETTASLGVADKGRIAATIRNVGSHPISVSQDGTATTIEAWALPLDPGRKAFRLAADPLDAALAPRASRVVRFAAPAVPSVVVVRLAGDPGAVGRATPAAALAVRGRNGRVTITALSISSPRDDALLRRKPAAGRISLASVDAAGSIRATITGGTDVPEVGAALAAVEGAPGRFSLLVRSLAAEPARAARPSASTLELPADPSSRAAVQVAGLPAGVRLVMSAVVPPDGGTADARTIRLAWIPVTALSGEGGAPD
jgi:hypothetical protein